MTTAAPADRRLLSLDVVRGVAVMGILLANMPGFALPSPTHFNPAGWSSATPSEIAVWFANFVFVEGKMRALFSVLFGASMLLILDRAQAAGEDPARVHFARMGVLFGFGLAHMYLIWFGDILALYALTGMVAFAFATLSAVRLLGMALAFLLGSMVWDALPLLAADLSMQVDIQAEITALRGGWLDNVAWRWREESFLGEFESGALETLSAMLVGMAAYRSGFLTGAWDRILYRRFVIFGLGIAFCAYALLALNTLAHGFDQRSIYIGSSLASAPFRILGTFGYAALIILLIKPGGHLTTRIAAVGRAAFSNYLMTSILVTAVFYGWGLGQFGEWSRAEIYLIPPLVWLAMLAWSKPWLDRFRYGPLEWLWRSIARGRLQPMRRHPVGSA